MENTLRLYLGEEWKKVLILIDDGGGGLMERQSKREEKQKKQAQRMKDTYQLSYNLTKQRWEEGNMAKRDLKR